MPVDDMFWGDRVGTVQDPFGYTWMLATHVKDLTPEESNRALKLNSQRRQRNRPLRRCPERKRCYFGGHTIRNSADDYGWCPPNSIEKGRATATMTTNSSPRCLRSRSASSPAFQGRITKARMMRAFVALGADTLPVHSAVQRTRVSLNVTPPLSFPFSNMVISR